MTLGVYMVDKCSDTCYNCLQNSPARWTDDLHGTDDLHAEVSLQEGVAFKTLSNQPRTCLSERRLECAGKEAGSFELEFDQLEVGKTRALHPRTCSRETALKEHIHA